MNAWPAEVIQTVDGWRLRFTEGVSRRANSAWSNESSGTTPLAERIAGVEAFYRARQVDACFHISVLSPPELNAVLAERGYTANGETVVQTAAIGELLASTSPSPASDRVEVHARVFETSAPDAHQTHDTWPSKTWQQVAWPSPALRPAVRSGILHRIAPASVCALVRDAAGDPVSAGLAVFERGHLGIFSMRTQEAVRGRGFGSVIRRALGLWGQKLGAQTAYLQVEEDNPSAQRVYARVGFRNAYRYHYQSRASDPTAS